MAADQRDAVSPDRVVSLRRAQVPAAARVLATALADDPGYRHLLPDGARRVEELAAIYRLTLADTVRHGQAFATVIGDIVTAVLAIYPPGHYPMTAARWARAGLRVAAVAARAREHSAAVVRFARLTASEVPAEAWYFQALGVRPDLQHAGRGGALLRHAVALADATGEPSYLETNNPENVAYYERLGYVRCHEPVPLAPGGPWIVAMLRPARGG